MSGLFFGFCLWLVSLVRPGCAKSIDRQAAPTLSPSNAGVVQDLRRAHSSPRAGGRLGEGSKLALNAGTWPRLGPSTPSPNPPPARGRERTLDPADRPTSDDRTLNADRAFCLGAPLRQSDSPRAYGRQSSGMARLRGAYPLAHPWPTSQGRRERADLRSDSGPSGWDQAAVDQDAGTRLGLAKRNRAVSRTWPRAALCRKGGRCWQTDTGRHFLCRRDPDRATDRSRRA